MVWGRIYHEQILLVCSLWRQIKTQPVSPQGKIVRPNIECTNGYIHLVDTVMMDESPPWTVLAASSTISSTSLTTFLLILPLLILHLMHWTSIINLIIYLKCSNLKYQKSDRWELWHYPCFITVSYISANKHMESNLRANLCNYFFYFFCLPFLWFTDYNQEAS